MYFGTFNYTRNASIMLFNTFDFAIFLPLIFVLYWFVTQKNLTSQNILVVIASYVFYGWWDWRFLSLLFLSSSIDFLIGLGMSRKTSNKSRKSLLIVSLVVNLGVLIYFKYFNFFIDSFIDTFTFFGSPISVNSLEIVLPVGISFYTFQTLSYSIDIYRGKLEPSKDPIAFFAFVSFFPQLVAGPIERATHLLPQFYKDRNFEYRKAVDGLRQILWGLFKKVVIADNCATYVTQIFDNSDQMSGSTLALGAVFFAFQIYGDFSGYSDIAIGIARLFGFDLMNNFKFPYFSRDIAEFWRRWHISLSTWFRDYLYIPLGGSKGSLAKKVRNTFIIFLVSGFWHGANWTFIFWGLLNAVYFLPLLLTKNNRSNLDQIEPGKIFPYLSTAIRITITFSLTCLAWVFFRAESVQHGFGYIAGIFSSSFFSVPTEGSPLIAILLLLFVSVEWIQRNKIHGLEISGTKIPRPIIWTSYMALILMILWIGGDQSDFIYFQF